MWLVCGVWCVVCGVWCVVGVCGWWVGVCVCVCVCVCVGVCVGVVCVCVAKTKTRRLLVSVGERPPMNMFFVRECPVNRTGQHARHLALRRKQASHVGTDVGSRVGKQINVAMSAPTHRKKVCSNSAPRQNTQVNATNKCADAP